MELHAQVWAATAMSCKDQQLLPKISRGHCKEMFSNNTYMSSIYSIAKDQARSCGFVVIEDLRRLEVQKNVPDFESPKKKLSEECQN